MIAFSSFTTRSIRGRGVDGRFGTAAGVLGLEVPAHRIVSVTFPNITASALDVAW